MNKNGKSLIILMVLCMLMLVIVEIINNRTTVMWCMNILTWAGIFYIISWYPDVVPTVVGCFVCGLSFCTRLGVLHSYSGDILGNAFDMILNTISILCYVIYIGMRLLYITKHVKVDLVREIQLYLYEFKCTKPLFTATVILVGMQSMVLGILMVLHNITLSWMCIGVITLGYAFIAFVNITIIGIFKSWERNLLSRLSEELSR